MNLPFHLDTTKLGDSALLWNGVGKKNQKKSGETVHEELQEDKMRGKEESLWKCIRCEKLTGQLNTPKRDQRLSQCHCRVVLFSTLPLFPLLQPPEEQLSGIPQCLLLVPLRQPHTLQPHHSLPSAFAQTAFLQSLASRRHFCFLCTAPEEGTQIPRACGEWGLADASVNTMLICLRY